MKLCKYSKTCKYFKEDSNTCLDNSLAKNYYEDRACGCYRENSKKSFNFKSLALILFLVCISCMGMVSAVGTYPAVDPNMVLYYHFNNDSAYGENDTHVYDFSGNGNNGTVFGGAVWNSTGGYLGDGSFSFNKTNYINVQDSNSLSAGSNITFSVWINPNDLSVVHYVFGKGTTSNWEYALKTAIDGRITFVFYQSTGASYAELVTNQYYTVSPNIWFNIALTYNGSTSILYYNGIPVVTNSTPVGSLTNRNQPLIVGNRRATIDIGFNGSIDEFIIYNRTLSEREIFNQYMGYLGCLGFPTLSNATIFLNNSYNENTSTSNNIDYSKLEMWLDFDENVGNFLDKSKNKNAVISYGLASTTTNGKIGSGMYFNVSDTGSEFSYLRVPHNENISFNGTDEISISFWVYPTDFSFCGEAGGIIEKSGTPYNLGVRCGNGIFNGVLWNGSYNPYTISVTIPSFQWSLYTITEKRYDGNKSEITAYLNGVRKAYQNITITGNLNNTGSWQIGSRGSSTFIRHFKGYMDEIMVFRKVLNQSEIQNIYSSTNTYSSHYGNNIQINTTYIDDKDTSSQLFYQWYSGDTLLKSGYGNDSYNSTFNINTNLKLIVNDTDNNSVTQYFPIIIDAKPKILGITLKDRDYISSSSIIVNYSLEGELRDSSGYSLDNGINNITLTNESMNNFTISLSGFGEKDLMIYANDTFRGLTINKLKFKYYNSTGCQQDYYFGDIQINYNKCNVSVIGKSYAIFNGNNSYINFGNNSFLTPPDSDYYTSFWIKPDKLGYAKQYIFNKYGGTPTKGYGAYVDNRNSSNIVYYNFDETGTERGVGSPTNKLVQDSWQHILIAKNNNYTSMYLNGQAVGSSGSGVVVTDSNTSSLIFGKNVINRFIGDISNFEVYKGSLSSWDVEDLWDDLSQQQSGNNYHVAILYGHTFNSENVDPDPALQISEIELRMLLNYLNNTNYSSITYYQYYQWRQGNGTINPHSFIIDFDDGATYDWLEIASIMAEYNYTGNANIVTGGCNTDCWNNLNTLHTTYGWDIASHGQRHCHHGSGVGGTVPSWCNSSEERIASMSGARNDIFGNMSFYPTAMAFPWNDWGINTQEKAIVMNDCATYYKMCFGSGTSLPTVAMATEYTNLTDGSLMRSNIGDGTVKNETLSGLNWTLTNYQSNLKILDIPFTSNLQEHSLNGFSGTGYNMQYGKDDYFKIVNYANENENIKITPLSSALLTNGTSICNGSSSNLALNSGNINITLNPNEFCYVLDNYSLIEGVSRENSPLWISSSTSSEKHIANNLSDNIYNVTTAVEIKGRCSHLASIDYVSDTGAYTQTFLEDDYTCSNGVVTLTIPAIEPATSSNVLKLTYDYENTELAPVCALLVGSSQELGDLLVLIILVIVMVTIIAMVMHGDLNLKEFFVGSILTIVFVAIINIVGAMIVSYIC